MINLNINNLKQHDFVTCGPYCVKMVLDYFGIPKSVEDICKICRLHSKGTLETSLVLGLRAIGVNSKLYMVPDGETIKGAYAGIASNKLVPILRRRSSRNRSVAKQGFAELAEVVQNGQVNFTIPTRILIEQELDEGNPWIIGVKPFALYGYNDKQAGLLHFIIIQGYDSQSFIINDPAPNEGGIRSITKDHLLYSMYSAEGRAICICKE